MYQNLDFDDPYDLEDAQEMVYMDFDELFKDYGIDMLDDEELEEVVMKINALESSRLKQDLTDAELELAFVLSEIEDKQQALENEGVQQARHK